MANEQNLDPVQTKEEARRRGRNGGIKSGEVRRRKRDMREAAKALLDMKVSSKQETMRAILKSLGVPEEDADYRMAVVAAMMLQAGNGNVNAATFLRDTSGDNPMVRVREEELKQKKAEFRFMKQQKMEERLKEETERTLADDIAAAYEGRSENEK